MFLLFKDLLEIQVIVEKLDKIAEVTAVLSDKPRRRLCRAHSQSPRDVCVRKTRQEAHLPERVALHGAHNDVLLVVLQLTDVDLAQGA